MLDGRKWEDEMLIWMKYSLLLFAYVFSLYEIRIHSVRLSIQRGWWDECDDVHVLGFDVVLVV